MISEKLLQNRKVYHRSSRAVFPYFRVSCPICSQSVELWIPQRRTDESCTHIVVDHNNAHGAVIEFGYDGKKASLNVVDLLSRVIAGIRPSGEHISPELLQNNGIIELEKAWARAKEPQAQGDEFFRFEEVTPTRARAHHPTNLPARPPCDIASQSDSESTSAQLQFQQRGHHRTLLCAHAHTSKRRGGPSP